MNKDSIIDFLGFIIVRALGILFCCIPLCLALWIGRRAGDLAYLVNSKRRLITYANLKSAFPEKELSEIKRITKSHFENLGMSIVELLKLPVMGKKYLDTHVNIENFDRIRIALDRNKGVIPLTAHFGNWEIASLVVSARGYRTSVFAREQKYTRLNNLLNKYREMTGCRVVTKGFSVRDIIKTLRENGIVGMLADQDAGPSGVFVDFLNRPASTAPGALVFSLKTGASILPSFIRRIGYDRHVLEIGEPLGLVNTGDKDKDVKVGLKKIANILESYIKRFPAEWLWSHKRWKTTPQRTVLVLSDGRPGHLNQAMAVAEMLEEAQGLRLKARGIEEKPIIKIHTVEVKFKTKLHRMLLDLCSLFAGSRCQGCLRCLRYSLEKETFKELKTKYADIVISCGVSTVGANVFLKYENNAKGVVIMKPGWGRGRKFDAVILPRHDAPKKSRSNVLITEAAPNRIREDAVKKAALRGTNNGIGLLIGGDAKGFKLEKAAVERVIDGISRIAEEMDLAIFISTSRRTSPEIDFLIKDKFKDNKRCKLLVIASEDNREGVVQEIFNQTEIIIVSPESISMISEAASSGRHAVVFRGELRGTKYDQAIASLEQQGYIKTASPDEIYNVVKKLLTAKPVVKRLDDRERITKRLEGIT